MTPTEYTKLKKTKWKTLKAQGFANRKDAFRPDCCQDERSDSFGDCDSFNWPKGPAMIIFLKFGESNEDFYSGYLFAWKKATENGWDVDPIGVVKSLDPAAAKSADDLKKWLPSKKQKSTKTHDVQLESDFADVFIDATDIHQEDYEADEDSIEEQLKA